MHTKPEVCKILGISVHTFAKWYEWQSRLLKEGKITEPYLPQPQPLITLRGKPNGFTDEQIEQLKQYQKTIVHGRNGVYGIYSNPLHKETKKYKKTLEEQNAN